MRIHYVFDESCDQSVRQRILMVENQSTGSTQAEVISRVLQNLNTFGLEITNIQSTNEDITFYVKGSRGNDKQVLFG